MGIVIVITRFLKLNLQLARFENINEIVRILSVFVLTYVYVSQILNDRARKIDCLFFHPLNRTRIMHIN